MAGRLRNDEGFSLLEVLFASFIAFFVLTALFGVLVMSATQGRIANADTVSTNLAQLVVEQARSMPYGSVGVTPTPAGEIDGPLPSTEPTVFQGLSFQIQRHVEWVHDPLSPIADSKDYKKFTVAVSWTGGHATPIVTYIRDHTNETPVPPMVAWLVSPPANAVLYSNPDTESASQTFIWDGSTTDGHLVDGGGAPLLASLQASASVVSTTGTIVRVEFQNNGMVLTTPFTGPSAPSVTPWPSTAYAIDLKLTTTTPSGETTSFFKEGINTLKVVATANNLAYAYQILLVTVDNLPPLFKTGDTVSLAIPSDNTDRFDGSLTMTWPPPRDGNDPAPYYNFWIEEWGSAITRPVLVQQDLGRSGAYLIGTGRPAGLAVDPFTVYRVTLWGKSVRGLAGNSKTSAYECNSPRLTGTVFNQASNKKADANYRFDLVVTPPRPDAATLAGAFGGASILYDVYSMSSATYVYPGAGDLPSTAYLEADNQDVPSIPVQSGLDCRKYMQVEAKVMAEDGVTVLKRIRSNVVGALVTGPAWQQSAPLPVP